MWRALPDGVRGALRKLRVASCRSLLASSNSRLAVAAIGEHQKVVMEAACMSNHYGAPYLEQWREAVVAHNMAICLASGRATRSPRNSGGHGGTAGYRARMPMASSPVGRRGHRHAELSAGVYAIYSVRNTLVPHMYRIIPH